MNGMILVSYILLISGLLTGLIGIHQALDTKLNVPEKGWQVSAYKANVLVDQHGNKLDRERLKPLYLVESKYTEELDKIFNKK